MTATTKPKSIAKRSITTLMDQSRQKTRLLPATSHLHKMDVLTSAKRKPDKITRLSSSLLIRRSTLLSRSQSHEQNEISTSLSTSCSLSSRLTETTISDEEEMAHKNKNKSNPIRTAAPADHRMTNNNRISHKHQQWSTTSALLFLIFYSSVVGLITVVNGHPDPEPVRVSHYSKSAKNDNPFNPKISPTSTTLRSTTIITSFLPSDAIPSTAPMFKSSKGWIPSGGSNRTVTNINFNDNHNNDKTNTSSNASSPEVQASRRSASARRRDSSFETVQTSIDRPFYTKITSEDAVAKPGYYSRQRIPTGLSSSSSKKGKKGSKGGSSKSSKHSKTKKGASSAEEAGSGAPGGPVDENVFIPHTTEKAYRPPKLSLEPFFNFLTSLASASREVMMSKEQQQHNNLQEYNDGTGGGKYATTTMSYYDTINESIRENAKTTRKPKKGKGKKKGKGHSHYHQHKSSKKGSRKSITTTTKRYKMRSEEISVEEEDEEEYDLAQELQFHLRQQQPPPPQTSPGPIPIPLPNPIIDQAELEEHDNPEPEGLHILDVLRTPMIPDYESPLPSPPRAEPLIDYHEMGNSINHNNDLPTNVTSSSSSSSSSAAASSQITGNPPSGRAASMNKGQGYLPFEKGEGANASGSGSSSSSSNAATSHVKLGNKREKQRSERGEVVDTFLDQHSAADLQAQESISHSAQVVVPYGNGLAPSQFHASQKQQQGKSNDPSQQPTQQAGSPDFAKNAGGLEQGAATAFGQTPGQSDVVSKYPMTFVYQNNGAPPAAAPPGSPPPQSRTPYISPLGIPPNALFGPPPSGRPPFRMNKLRPNLHSYYDPSYHHYAGVGEHQVASEMVGIRHPYGPPHFKPPPHAMPPPPGNLYNANNNMSPLPSPPRFGNGYGNRPGYMMMPPHRGTHYVGHTLSGAPASSMERLPNKVYNDDGNTSGASSDYQLDQTSNNNDNGDSSLMMSQDDLVGGSVSDPIDQFVGPGDLTGNSIVNPTGGEHSETKKVGIMDSFDLFYKEYKVLTWIAIFFCTSMALLTLLVYMYINNPPTEVVQARFLPWSDLLKNPQISRFLSSLAELGSSKRMDAFLPDKNFKPYGKGLGTQSGKQKRKQTRTQLDKEKLIRRLNKMRRRNNGSTNDGGASPTSTNVQFPFNNPVKTFVAETATHHKL